MEYLNWELSVLSRAIAYPNLSGASSHIGLSQPQLSRIVAKLEAEHSLVLLDRDAKRKSGWTADATRLSEVYNKLVQQFKVDVQTMNAAAEPSIIRVGALEGLIDLAIELCGAIFKKTAVTTIDLVVADLDDLDAQYFKGGLEFLLTSREPGRKKMRYSRIIGYQSLDTHENSEGVSVLSFFEHTTMSAANRRKLNRTFISNSLAAREKWLKHQGGRGVFPSSIKQKPRRTTNEMPVILLAPDNLPESLWQKTLKIDFFAEK